MATKRKNKTTVNSADGFLCEARAGVLFELHIEPGGIQIEAAAGGQAGNDDAPESPRFSMIAYNGGDMNVDRWSYPVVIDLAGLKIPSQSCPVRFNHDSTAGVGHTESIAVVKNRIIATGVISRDTPESREIVVSAKNGFPWQASVGITVTESRFVDEREVAEVNDRKFKGPLTIVRKGILGEISFVDLGADNKTVVKVAASKENVSMAKKKTKLAEAGEVEVEADGDEVGEVEASVPTETEPVTKEVNKPEPAATPATEIRAAAVEETNRIAAIRGVCEGKHSEIEAKAIGEGWSENTTELAVLRAERPKPPDIHVLDNSVSSEALTAAVCLSGGLKDPESYFDTKTLEAADRSFRQGVGLQELILEAAASNGYQSRSFRSDMEGNLRAAFSTASLPGILSNVANKFLLAGFQGVEDVWKQIAAIRSVRDFKAVSSYRLTGAFEFAEVGPDGELKHGTVDEQTFTNQAKTFGRMFGVTRTDMINDDLGALTALPQRIGRGGALKLNKVFWTAFLNNSAFFASGNNNYTAGAGTVLAVAGLTSAELLFLNQTDPDGEPLALMPKILLVPPALSVTAAGLMNSLELRNTTASKEYTTFNPHAGKFTSLASTYLSNATIAGYSALAWYLLTDPADLPVIEVAFLNGQQTPTVERADADFNTLGIQFRGYFDFGVALQDFRAGVKMKGEA